MFINDCVCLLQSSKLMVVFYNSAAKTWRGWVRLQVQHQKYWELFTGTIVIWYTIVSWFLIHVACSTVLNIVSISPPQWTPLHIAVEEFQMHTVEALVFNKADINSQDNNGVITWIKCRWCCLFELWVSIILPGTKERVLICSCIIIS